MEKREVHTHDRKSDTLKLDGVSIVDGGYRQYLIEVTSILSLLYQNHNWDLC